MKNTIGGKRQGHMKAATALPFHFAAGIFDAALYLDATHLDFLHPDVLHPDVLHPDVTDLAIQHMHVRPLAFPMLLGTTNVLATYWHVKDFDRGAHTHESSAYELDSYQNELKISRLS